MKCAKNAPRNETGWRCPRNKMGGESPRCYMDWPSRNTGQCKLKEGIAHETGMAGPKEVQQTRLNDIVAETTQWHGRSTS